MGSMWRILAGFTLTVLSVVDSSFLQTEICEGEKGWLQCPAGSILKIMGVFWGRDDHITCGKVPSGLTLEKLCEANMDNTWNKVRDSCKDEQACEIVASNIFFDDN